MIMPVIDYIRQKGFEFKQAGEQYVLKFCVFCQNDKGHFYIHKETGLWDCKICGATGNLYQLKDKLGDIQQKKVPFAPSAPRIPAKPITGLQARIEKSHHALLNDQQALDYLLNDRKLTQQTINRFKIGLEVEEGKRSIAIPLTRKGKPVNIKFRSLPPAEKLFWRIPDAASTLFNEEAIDHFPEIIITEGEIDALTLIQEGYENVIANTLGASGFAPEWIDQLVGKKIFICYDNDSAGRKGAKKLGRSLGYVNVNCITLPEKDINLLLTKHAENFKGLFEEAKEKAEPLSPEWLFPLHSIPGDLDLGLDDPGLQTPWPTFNKKVGGFKPGDLIVVSALPKIGKTTFCLNIAAFNARKGFPVLFYCLEMPPERLRKKLVQSELKVMESEISLEKIKEMNQRFTENSLVFGYNSGRVNVEQVAEYIKIGVQYYGFDLVIFDHLHFLVRSSTNQTQEISLAVNTFKMLASELEIPIILIVQPKKTNEEIMGMADFRDSSLIAADCDMAIILHRRKNRSKVEGEEVQESFSPKTLVRIEASRFMPGGDLYLMLKGELSCFYEMEFNQEEEGERYVQDTVF